MIEVTRAVLSELCCSSWPGGQGMSAQRLADIQSGGSGVGIRGMRERLSQFKGEMRIESDNTGTRVFVSIRIPNSTPGEDAPNTEPIQTAV